MSSKSTVDFHYPVQVCKLGLEVIIIIMVGTHREGQLNVCVCVCVFFPFILDTSSLDVPARVTQGKVTQDFPSTFFLRCVP